MALVAFLVSVAYWPHSPAFAVAPKWAVLAVGLPVALWYVRLRMTAAHWLGLGLIVYAAASLAWTPVLWDGLQGMWELLLVAAAFCIGAERDDLGEVYLGFAMGLIPSAVLAILQHFNISPVLQLIGPAGLFGNKNFMGETAALVVIGLAASRVRLDWCFLPAPVVCVILSGSRAAWLGLLVAAAIWGWQRWRYGTAAAEAMVCVIGLAVIIWQPYLVDTLKAREAIWGDAIHGLTWQGHGIASFYADVTWRAQPQPLLIQRTEHAHNDLLEMAFELGPAALLFLAVLALAFGAPGEIERMVLAAFLVEAAFGFPLHMPATAFLGALVAGCLCGRRGRLQRALVDSGDAGWARRLGKPEGQDGEDETAARGGGSVPARL